jgi:Recombination endonuclease VII
MAMDPATKKEKAWTRHLMNNFKLTPEKWDRVETFQKKVCWICGRPNYTGKRLSTDHAHTDGLFRGLLCQQCNPLLGKLERAYIRLGLHKVSGLDFVTIVSRLALYVQNPPATAALGGPHYGYAGSVNTKTHRKRLKKLAREEKAKLKRRR